MTTNKTEELAEEIMELIFVSNNGVFNDGTTNAVANLLAAEQRAQQGWRDISTAPKDGKRHLYINTRMNFPLNTILVAEHAWQHSEDGVYRVGVYNLGQYTNVFSPTHWMPLPSAPNTDTVTTATDYQRGFADGVLESVELSAELVRTDTALCDALLSGVEPVRAVRVIEQLARRIEAQAIEAEIGGKS